jgi:hypothetical protein
MYFDSTQVNMQQILNHDYLKQALEDRLGKNTQDALNMKQSKNKDILNKAATLRSKSVLKQIKNKDYEEYMEDMKLHKANNNTISFAEIEKHQFKHKKELSLPPIMNGMSNQNQSSVQGSPRKGIVLETSVISLVNGGNTSSIHPGSPIKKPDVIDQIHKLRLHIHEKGETDSNNLKVLISKKEKDQILSNYFNAKK